MEDLKKKHLSRQQFELKNFSSLRKLPEFNVMIFLNKPFFFILVRKGIRMKVIEDETVYNALKAANIGYSKLNPRQQVQLLTGLESSINLLITY